MSETVSGTLTADQTAMVGELQEVMDQASAFQLQLQIMNIEHSVENAKHEMVMSVANRVAQSGS